MDVKKQPHYVPKTPANGKKRKKKKPKKEKDNDKTGGVATRKPLEYTKTKEVVSLTGAIVVTKLDATQCSSSSSIESHKPVLKLARFDYNSSDGMSKGERSDVSPMESSDHSHAHHAHSTSQPHTKHTDASTVPIKPKQNEDILSPKIFETKSLATLRWLNQLPDEEREQERIEGYKEERRERYKRDILLKKEGRESKTAHSYHRAVGTVKL